MSYYNIGGVNHFEKYWKDRAGLETPFRAWYEIRETYKCFYRYYHNWQHIKYVLKFMTKQMGADKQLRVLSLKPAMWIAAYCHDLVYLPGYPDNEVESADQTSHLIRIYGGGQAFADRVAELIRYTDHQHTWAVEANDDKEAMILLDADLYKLGTPQYKINVAAIRKEYGMVSEKDWKAGRKQFLEMMLSRPYIFFLAKEYEKKAKQNMEAELREL